MNPRAHEAKNPEASSSLIGRLGSCHSNGLEAFPAIAAAVLACTVNTAPPFKVAGLAFKYVFVRFVYSFLYAIGSTKELAAARTVAWAISFRMLFQMFSLAIAGKVRKN